MQGACEAVRRTHEIIHNLTTADAPQTIYYIRERFRLADEAGIAVPSSILINKGKKSYDVEPDTPKENTADPTGTLLLRGF